MKLRSPSFCHFLVLTALAALCAAPPAGAQDTGRVLPASLPLPLPSVLPMPPSRLRSHNPWNLPLTGPWHFALTHGQVIAGEFRPSTAGANGIKASSNEDKNLPENAFDGSLETRWCASDSSFPQTLEADLGKVRPVAGVTLQWEKPGENYQYRIEGGRDGKHWQPLTDTPIRFVRVTVQGNSSGHWASLREVQIRLIEGGREIVWKPTPVKRVSVSNAVRDAFSGLGFDDTRWDTLAVPSNWEMAGYSLPTYNSVDTTVGLYRRFVAIPAAWAGRRIYWHFDGVLNGAEVFVNGHRAGYHESGYTAFDVDLTGLVKPGARNLLAVRVSKTTPSDDCETGDFQAMGGIYRDTALVAVPTTYISDLVVRTPLTANYQDATLSAQVSVSGRPGAAITLSGRLFGAGGKATAVTLAGSGRIEAGGTAVLTLSTPVKSPKLWSAEKPNLYTLVLSLNQNSTIGNQNGPAGERIQQRFGFKQIEVKNNVVLWNGQPIKCTGICRHDFWADKGFALTDTEWNKDLALMKAANINAIRTSHYNHAARFLELCEEQGFYVLDEVPYCWINDQVKDLKYAPFLLQRARETLARDKNRPCVLAWSIGNENPYGIDSQMVSDMLRRADPTRPNFVSCTSPNDVKGQPWEDNHYPGPDSVDRFGKNPKWGANLTEHPHTFYEKEVQEYDPGASDLWSETLIKTWDKLWKSPNILGAFIWEWQNQGIADKNADRTHEFWYGPDRLRQENNKGIVSAYRVPKPEWWIVKMAYSPVVVDKRTVSPIRGACTVPLTNHYSFTDLKELTCRWAALREGATLVSGVRHIACAPMQSVEAAFPAPLGMTKLRLEFHRPDGTLVVASNLAAEGVSLPPAPAAQTSGGTLVTQDGLDTLTVSSPQQQLIFDKHTGTIQSWWVAGRDRLSGGPTLNLGEAMNSQEKGYYLAKQPPVTRDAHLVTSVLPEGGTHIEVTSTVLAGDGGAVLGTFAASYDLKPNAEMTVAWTLNWTAPDTALWEQGVTLKVPAGMTRMHWQRDSYFADYPAGHLGEPSGICVAGDPRFRASKRGLHWMTLTDGSGVGIALLPTSTPLIGRADSSISGLTLRASREVAGPRGLSGSWVEDHAIHAVTGKALSGSFMLRAISAAATKSALSEKRSPAAQGRVRL